MDNKIMASALGGAITVILVWLLQTFVKVVIPAEVASAITVIVTTVVGYLVPSNAISSS